MDITLKAQARKAKIKKWGYVRPKSFFPGKEATKRIKRQPMECEMVVNCTSD